MPKTTKYLANWLSLYNDYPEKDQVEKKDFRLILKMFNHLLAEEMLEGKMFKLPHSVGILGLVKMGTGLKARDYGLYDTHGRVVQRNLHSDGYMVKSWFVKPAFRIFYKAMKFKMKRGVARRLAKLIKEEGYINKYMFDPHENYDDKVRFI